jgi:hypothetical protein
LLYLEKYSVGKDKKTYMMIPSNHPIYKFPYNLEDRLDFIKKRIKKEIKIKIDMSTKKTKNKDGLPVHTISIKNNSKLKDYIDLFNELDAKLVGGRWTILVG